MHSEFLPTRRALLTGAAAAALTAATPLRALTTPQAQALVQALVDEINAVIASGRSREAMYREFERIFVRYADVPTIARTTLGPDARALSPAQMRDFTAAFQGYIARKYGSRFREWVGGRIEVQGARKVKSFYEVRSVAVLRGRSPFDLTFLVSDRSGQDRFFDMLIQGVSLLKSERAEIGAMFDRRRGDIAALTADLRRAG
ncbi:ABC transporter substrate-binding protein [Rhodobacteraceae bacterium CCMM004]|nr:ABC transporter substrate-binding protein [Rhodobacteraceae bacterium CCMM004]